MDKREQKVCNCIAALVIEDTVEGEKRENKKMNKQQSLKDTADYKEIMQMTHRDFLLLLRYIESDIKPH